MPTRPTFTTHDDYLATQPEAVAARIRRVLALVESKVPAAEPCIAYGMPAYRVGRGGNVFVYVAGFQKHLGIYPPVHDDAALVDALAPYRNAKGNLAFPHRDPLPEALIGRVVVALHAQYARG